MRGWEGVVIQYDALPILATHVNLNTDLADDSRGAYHSV